MNSQSTQIISKEVLEAVTTPEFVRDAVEAVRAGNFAQARMKLESGMQTHRSVVGLLALAEAYWDDPDPSSRDPKKSIDSLKDAIQLAPKDARPYALLGRYLLSKGLREQALNFLDRAIELDPADASSRRLRNRATLQAKKQYNVVIQGATPTEGAQSANTQAPREEVTRLLQIDPSKAAEKLTEEAEEANELEAIQAALGSLFGGSLLEANIGILQEKSVKRRRFGIVHFFIGLVGVATLGLAFGGALSWFAPEEAPSELQKQTRWLEEDSPKSLVQVTDNREEEPTPRRKMQIALAHVLLYVAHGGDKGHLDVARDALSEADAETKQIPEALYARALLLGAARSYEDPALDADLDALHALTPPPTSAYVYLAKAERLRHVDAFSQSAKVLEQALALPDAPRRVQLELAKTLAHLGETQQAQKLLQRLLRQHPAYSAALPYSTVLSLSEWASAPEDDAKKEAFQNAFQKAHTLLDLQNDASVQKITLALALAPIAAGTGEDEKYNALLVEAQKDDVLLGYPGLLKSFVELMLLQGNDFSRVESLISNALDTFPEEVPLVFNQARAQVAISLNEKTMRRIRTQRQAKLAKGKIEFPLGNMVFDFNLAPYPFGSRFDAQYFPERSILSSSNEGELSAQAIQRRLGVAVQLRLASAALEAGNLSKMAERIAEAEKEAPTDPQVHLLKAKLYQQRKATAKARASLDEAVQYGSGDPGILIEAASLQMDMGRADDAQQTLASLADESISSPTATLQEARLALLADEAKDALKFVSQALESTPESLLIGMEAIQMFVDAKRPDEAIEVARVVHKSLNEANAPTSPKRATALAFLLWAKSEDESSTSEAEKMFQALLDRAPDEPWVQFVNAKRWEARGDSSEAKNAFAKAMELNDGELKRIAGDELRKLKANTKRTKPNKRKRRRK